MTTDSPDWPALMKPETAAAYIEISPRQINRLRAAKEFPPPVEVGGSPRYRRTDLDSWIKRLKTKAA